MYQRYYKQRKFGRIFSFCMVIGSGLSYYVKTSVKTVKNLFKIDKLSAYSEYLPENLKSVVENLRDLEKAKVYSELKSEVSNFSNMSSEDLISRFREDKFSVKNRYWIYKNNLDRSCKVITDDHENKNKLYSNEMKNLNMDFYPNEMKQCIPANKEVVKFKETYKLYRYIKNLNI